MRLVDQKICAWGGPFCCVLFGAGLLIAGFLPPPSPQLTAAQVAEFYRANSAAIRVGMALSLLGMAGYVTFVAAVSAQMRRIQGVSPLPVLLQLGSGSIGVLTVMFPIMVFAITAFRPERNPELTQLLNDLGWLVIIPAFPTFLAQFAAIAFGVLQDESPQPVYPRWAAWFNLWIGLLFAPGVLAYFLRSGPFAWNGLISFWLAAVAFFAWLVVMTTLTLRAIDVDG